jgi:hypothetical protein
MHVSGYSGGCCLNLGRRSVIKATEAVSVLFLTKPIISFTKPGQHFLRILAILLGNSGDSQQSYLAQQQRTQRVRTQQSVFAPLAATAVC